MNEQEFQIENAKRKHTVFLEISSWRGISLGAVHYYGTLTIQCECTKFPCDCNRKVNLVRKLTSSQAKELTKLQNDNSLFGVGYRWKMGDETKCFDTKEDVINKALEVWRTEFPTKTRLVLGSIVYCEPEKVLCEFV